MSLQGGGAQGEPGEHGQHFMWKGIKVIFRVSTLRCGRSGAM